MGNRKAREFVLRQAEEAAWERSRTEERPATADLDAPGIGHRRVQVIRCPAFEQGAAWDARQHPDGWRVYRSRVVGGRWPAVRVVGYDPVPADPAAVEEVCGRLSALVVPLNPAGGRAGADGTCYQIAVFDLFCGWQAQWWEQPPSQWAALGGITADLIKLFESAGGGSHAAT